MRTFRLLLILFVAACGALGTMAAEIPAVPGWTPLDDERTFPSGELWRHINGAAELFESHQVTELTVQTMGRQQLEVAVSVYEMSSPLNAFGVYGVERSGRGTEISAGAAAVLYAPYQALMLKDRLYVKVQARKGDLDEGAATLLLSGLAEALPGSNEIPAEVRLLPELGRTEGTLSYTAEGFLGLSELRRCIHAEYTLEDGSAGTVFVVLPEKGQNAGELWKSLPDAWTLTGEIERFRIREIPYRGPVAVTPTEFGLLGALGPQEPEPLLNWLSELR